MKLRSSILRLNANLRRMNKLINLYDVSAAYLQNIKEEIEKNKTKINLIFNQLEKIKHMKLEDLSKEDIEELISENGILIVESSDVIKQQSQLVEKFKSWTSILEKVIKKYPFDVTIFTSEILYRQQDVTIENLTELLQYNEKKENYEVCQMILNTINLIRTLWSYFLYNVYFIDTLMTLILKLVGLAMSPAGSGAFKAVEEENTELP